MFKKTMEKKQFSDLDLTPSAKNARQCANFAIAKPFSLHQDDVDQIIKMIKQTFKKEKNANVNYRLLLQMQISLDAYGFYYDKNFLDEKAVDNLNFIYLSLLGNKQALSQEGQSFYTFLLNNFYRDAQNIDKKILDKMLCSNIEQKTLD